VIDNDAVTLEVLDTSRLEEFQTRRLEENARLGDGFLLVYSITRRSSFEEVCNIQRQIINLKKELLVDGRRPMVLVGNNADCEDEREVSQSGLSSWKAADYRRASTSCVISMSILGDFSADSTKR
jgi:GTPase KRas protein